MKMNLKIALLTALTSVAALTGCDDKTSVEWYMAHHDDMLVKYRECFFNQNFEPIECQHARKPPTPSCLSLRPKAGRA